MKVGVIGAGTMGSGIAQAFAQTEGYEVCLCDINDEFAANGKNKIAKGFEKRVAKGKMDQAAADSILAKITTGTKEICTDCDLIVEAALEVMDVKKQTFKELQDIVKKDCMFATNTSSLSITEIGAGLDRPVIGMHFFNPAPVMKLIEVIAGENTPDDMVEKIVAISKEIGKTPVEVKEAAGFVVNRILLPMMNEAVGIWHDGMGSTGIKACHRIALMICADRKLRLIAIAVRLVHANHRLHDLIHKFRCETADSNQIVSHLVCLIRKLS